MRQSASLLVAVQSVDARGRKRYATAATILLLHLFALRVLMHGHAHRVQSGQKEDRQIAVYFLPSSHVDDKQKSSAHEPMPSASTIRTGNREGRAHPIVQLTAPSSSMTVEPIAITPPPESTQPDEDIVSKSLKSIAKIDRELRASNELHGDSPTMWGSNKFGRAISSAARSRESGAETYVDYNGRVITRLPGSGSCVARAGDSSPDGIDHIQGGEKLQVVPCAN